MKEAGKALAVVVFLAVAASCVSQKTAFRRLETAREPIGTTDYIPLATVCDVLDIDYYWDAGMQKHVLAKKGSFVSFLPDDHLVVIDGEIRSLTAPPRQKDGRMLIPKELADIRWWDQSQWWEDWKPAFGRSRTIEKVVIDAGHGGKDLGAQGLYGLEEKQITLDIAQRLAEKLEAMGIKTVLTRDEDRYLSLSERTWIANNAGADLLVSIHANSAESREARGVEIYHVSADAVDKIKGLPPFGMTTIVPLYPTAQEFLPEWGGAETAGAGSAGVDTRNRKRSVELARAIDNSLAKDASLEKRGIKEAGFFVLRWTARPAVLIEAGFLTNYNEAMKLASPQYQEQLAARIAEGIMIYKAEYESTRGFASS